MKQKAGAIHVAKASRLPMRAVERVEFAAGKGIVGDRYHGTRHRHITIQSLEELADAAVRHGSSVAPGDTRRSVTLSSGVMPRTPGYRWSIGAIEREVVRGAAPCKLLEDVLGPGARWALYRTNRAKTWSSRSHTHFLTVVTPAQKGSPLPGRFPSTPQDPHG